MSFVRITVDVIGGGGGLSFFFDFTIFLEANNDAK